MRYVEVACRLLVAAVFIGALLGKVTGRTAYRAFVGSLRTMAVLPDRAVGPVAALAVAAEAVVALLVLIPARWCGVAGFAGAVAVLSAFTTAIGVSLSRGNRAPCRCFGASTSPLGAHHVVRNLTLIAASVLGLAASLADGRVAVGPAVVAATLGTVLGVLTTRLDDIVALVRPGG